MTNQHFHDGQPQLATRFIDPATPRTGQQAALGADLVDLPDTLCISTAILAGVDWGGRAACVAAALWPDRCAGLVTVNGYLTARADTHTWNADSPVSQS